MTNKLVNGANSTRFKGEPDTKHQKHLQVILKKWIGSETGLSFQSTHTHKIKTHTRQVYTAPYMLPHFHVDAVPSRGVRAYTSTCK
eukprot:m.167155 g.167155  ORF g.167155 m.167155 type:complete len:86 (-) comp14452_c0_seq3:275-532(-)